MTETVTDQTAHVVPETGSRLEQMHAAYADAKAAADQAEKQLKAITDAIKLELTAAAPEGSARIALLGEGGPPLRLTYSETWRFDSKYAPIASAWRPAEDMFEAALGLLKEGSDPDRMLAGAAAWVEKWSRLVEEQEAGVQLDGRASIYTGETYAQARDRWDAYRGLLVEHLRGPDGGGA